MMPISGQEAGNIEPANPPPMPPATGGHGTHVVGSIVGSHANGGVSQEYSGMAPNAKVAFFDLMAGPGDSGLDVPEALEEDYFNWAYGVGEWVRWWLGESEHFSTIMVTVVVMVWGILLLCGGEGLLTGGVLVG